MNYRKAAALIFALCLIASSGVMPVSAAVIEDTGSVVPYYLALREISADLSIDGTVATCRGTARTMVSSCTATVTMELQKKMVHGRQSNPGLTRHPLCRYQKLITL